MVNKTGNAGGLKGRSTASAMSPRHELAVLGGYATVLTLVSFGIAHGDRLALTSWEWIAFPACTFAAGFWLGRWYAGLLIFVPALALAAFASDGGSLVFFEVLFGAPVVAVACFVGVGARKLVDCLAARGRGDGGLRRAPGVLAVGVACTASAPVGIALLEQGDVVREHRSRPLAIDERTGRLDGVGIGDAASRVIARFGAAPRWTTAQPDSPFDLGPGDYLGPTYVPTLQRGVPYVLRYQHASFDVTGGVVNEIQVTDTNAQTHEGIGPGDSIALVQRLYPQLRCAEGDAGEDEPIPFRFCTGQTGPHSYVYFSGDYSKRGSPITDITITPVRLNS